MHRFWVLNLPELSFVAGVSGFEGVCCIKVLTSQQHIAFLLEGSCELGARNSNSSHFRLWGSQGGGQPDRDCTYLSTLNPRHSQVGEKDIGKGTPKNLTGP